MHLFLQREVQLPIFSDGFLFELLEKGFFQTAVVLVEHGVDVCVLDKDNKSLLWTVVHKTDEETVRRFLKAGAGVYWKKCPATTHKLSGTTKLASTDWSRGKAGYGSGDMATSMAESSPQDVAVAKSQRIPGRGTKGTAQHVSEHAAVLTTTGNRAGDSTISTHWNGSTDVTKATTRRDSEDCAKAKPTESKDGNVSKDTMANTTHGLQGGVVMTNRPTHQGGTMEMTEGRPKNDVIVPVTESISSRGAKPMPDHEQGSNDAVALTKRTLPDESQATTEQACLDGAMSDSGSPNEATPISRNMAMTKCVSLGETGSTRNNDMVEVRATTVGVGNEVECLTADDSPVNMTTESNPIPGQHHVDDLLTEAARRNNLGIIEALSEYGITERTSSALFAAAEHVDWTALKNLLRLGNWKASDVHDALLLHSSLRLKEACTLNENAEGRHGVDQENLLQLASETFRRACEEAGQGPIASPGRSFRVMEIAAQHLQKATNIVEFQRLLSTTLPSSSSQPVSVIHQHGLLVLEQVRRFSVRGLLLDVMRATVVT